MKRKARVVKPPTQAQVRQRTRNFVMKGHVARAKGLLDYILAFGEETKSLSNMERLSILAASKQLHLVTQNFQAETKSIRSNN